MIKVYDSYDCADDPDYVMATRIAIAEEKKETTVVCCPEGYDIKISRKFLNALLKIGF